MPLIRYTFFLFIFIIIAEAHAIEQIKTHWQENIPKKAIELTKKGRTKGKHFKFDDAIKTFEEALKIKKDYYWATYNLALAYFLSSGDHTEEAEKTFLKAETLAKQNDIHDPLLHDMFGQFYFTQKEYIKAQNQYNKALAIDNTYLRTINNLGALYEAMKNNKKALSTYQKAMVKGLPLAKINYNRLLKKIEKESKEDISLLPPTYFTHRREGDSEEGETFFDNIGTAGMPTQ